MTVVSLGTESVFPPRHRHSVEGLRQEREARLQEREARIQSYRRAQSLSPSRDGSQGGGACPQGGGACSQGGGPITHQAQPLSQEVSDSTR